MKVLIIAFGHPDNVFSLSHYLSKKVELTLLFCVANQHYQEGLLNIKLNKDDNLIIREKKRIRQIIPKNILDFINGDFRLWVFNQKSRKVLNLQNWIDIYKLQKYINKEHFDVIHYNGESGFIIPLYYFNLNKKQLWTLHDYKPHSGEETKIMELVNLFIVKRKKLTLIQHYKYLQNESIKHFNLKKEKVKLLRSGTLDVLKKFKGIKIIEGDYFLFFGRISKYKGIDNLLKAYNNILNPKWKLVVAGRGNFWFDVSEYKNNNNIIFINRYIETEELVGLISNSKFVVTPYIDATHSAVIMSAYVFNKPVIASNLEGIKEVVKNYVTGIIFSNENPVNELKLVLESLMFEESILNKMSANIKEEKKHGELSWENIVLNYRRVYGE